MERSRTEESPIPLCVPHLRGNEWEYVKSCLDTGWVSSVGSFVDRFERELARRAGTRYAVATTCGTAALHAALLAVGVEPGDEVLVSTLTFIASANAVRYAGAHGVFIDAEPRHWQIDADLVRNFLERDCIWRDGALYNRATGRRVRAMMPVHILGHAVDMDPLDELAHEYELPIVEDASEGLGALYKGRPLGSLGDAGCLSFNGNKIVTTGGGGAVVTNDKRIAERVRYLTTQAKNDPLEYVHHEVGYNYRLTNVAAAIGCAQLEMLDDYVAEKRRTAEHYAATLAEFDGIGLFQTSPDVFCTYWMSVARLDPQVAPLDRRQLGELLRRRKIETRPLWQPMHQSPAHAVAQAIVRGVADRLCDECLCLPCSVGLTDADRQRVLDAILHSLSSRAAA